VKAGLKSSVVYFVAPVIFFPWSEVQIAQSAIQKNSSVAKALYTDLCMMRQYLVFDRILSHKYMKCVLIMSWLAIKGRKHISFARILNVGYCLDEPANSLNKHPRDVCPANGEN